MSIIPGDLVVGGQRRIALYSVESWGIADRVPKGFAGSVCACVCVNKGRLIGLITKHELATPVDRLYLLWTGRRRDAWR